MLWERWLSHLVTFFVLPTAALLILSLLLLASHPTFLQPRRKLAAYVSWTFVAGLASYTALLHRDGS